MTTILKFGKNIAYPVDFNTRQSIINFIYDKLEDLHNFSYNILNNISKLKFLKNNEHLVSPNYKGLNYFIIFTSINNKNYCIALDRKKLSYSKSQIDIKTLNIYNLGTKNIPDALFNGTILDGKIINNSIFLIQDCYYLMGNNMLNMILNDKINLLDETIINNLKDNILNFDLKLNKLYTYNNLEELISNLSKLSYSTNGLIFFPKLSGKNILFLENNNLKKNDNQIYKKENDNQIYKKENDNIPFKDENEENKDILLNYTNILKARTYSYENTYDFKILSLTKTDIPDVYNIYNDNNEKLGIALIPNLKISHMCESYIKTSEPVKFKCSFSEKFKKWIPISVV